MRVEGLSTAEFGQSYSPGTESAKGREAYVLKRRAAERREDTIYKEGINYVRRKGEGKEETGIVDHLSEIREEMSAN